MSSALDLLRCSSLERAALRLQPFLAARRNAGKQINIDALTTKNRNPIPDAVMVRALTAGLGPVDKLRVRALTPLPRAPRKIGAETLRRIPSSLWQDWAIRILPPDIKNGHRRDTTRAVLAILLATIGNRAPEAEIAHDLGLGSFGAQWAKNQASYVAALLRKDPLWTNIAEALTRLADYLAVQPCPINYARRRQVTYRKLLPDNEWQPIFDATDFGQLNCARTGQLIRTWLFQRVSTLPAQMAPFTGGSAAPADRHSEPIELLGPPIVSQLDEIVLRFLKQHNIFDEAVAWSPPLSLVADLQLPGPDVDMLKINDLHAEILKGPRAFHDAAKALGVRPHVVRYLLERTPLPRPVCRGQLRPKKETRLDRARLLLPHREFTRLYNDEKRSLLLSLSISISTHGCQTARTRISHSHSPDRKPSTAHASRWLRQEYVVNQRSLTDIAREAGVSRSTVSKRAKESVFSASCGRR